MKTFKNLTYVESLTEYTDLLLSASSLLGQKKIQILINKKTHHEMGFKFLQFRN